VCWTMRGVRDALRQAWIDSQPGLTGGHEEGGFVLRAADGSLTVERWQRGTGANIVLPPFPGGRRNGLPIVATFHTHPNTGDDYEQGPSDDDIAGVENDPDLGHPEYEGEYVISEALLYQIGRDGKVTEVGPTPTLLGLPAGGVP
jgi:hypothetical protein